MQELRLHQAILVMAPLGPGVGEEDKNRGKANSIRQRTEKVICGGLDEMQVTQLRSFALAVGAGNAVAADIESEAQTVRVGGSIGGEKMAVTASNLADKGARWTKNA